MEEMPVKLRSLFVLLIAAALGTTALAQSLLTGTIAGKGNDSSGARLPGVTVTLTSPVLITPRVATTDDEGGYRFPSLPAGKYALGFELTGFRKLSRSEVVVSIATTPPSRLTCLLEGRLRSWRALLSCPRSSPWIRCCRGSE